MARRTAKGEGGNTILIVLIAFAVLGVFVGSSTILMEMRSAHLRRNKMVTKVQEKMTLLRQVLSAPQMCQWAFRDAANNLVRWVNVNAPVAVNQIQSDPDLGGPAPPTLNWVVGDTIGSDLRIETIRLEQSTGANGDPPPSSSVLTRQAPTFPGGARPAALVGFRSYLAKLTITFRSPVIGGSPAPGVIFLNVERRDATGDVEHCYPAFNNLTNNLSLLNAMGGFCTAANSSPLPFRWDAVNFTWQYCVGGACVPDPCPATCTTFTNIGFNANGIPLCQCGCLPPIVIGPPPGPPNAGPCLGLGAPFEYPPTLWYRCRCDGWAPTPRGTMRCVSHSWQLLNPIVPVAGPRFRIPPTTAEPW